nr:ribonuclease H-like domain-containing protein [Tanacetum cinerariifolium]
MSANDKSGLGYGDYTYGSILSYENEVLQSVFMNKTSDLEDTPVNDRFANRMHAVPPPMTGNYMPFGPDVEIHYSKFTYGPKQTAADESDSKPSEYASCEFDSSEETSTSMPEPIENASKVVCEPKDDPHRALKDKGTVDSGCSRHITEDKAHLVDYQEFKGGSVACGGSNGKITGKGKIKTGRLDFEDVYYVEELKHYNLFSVSQMCDKKKKVLFIDIDCLVMSFDFKLPDENQVLLKILRPHNMYSFNLKNIYPSGDLSCLFAKASIDESNKWHRRQGHVNFKNLNKLVKGNLVRGLPSKIFENDHTCVAYQKRKATQGLLFILPTIFWAEAVNTTCYVLNTVLVIKPQNKTPYELLTGTQSNDDQSANSKEIDLNEEHFVLPIWSAYLTTVKSSGDKIEKNIGFKTCEKPNASTSSTNLIHTSSTPLSTVGPSRALNNGELSYLDPSKYALPDDPLMSHLEDIFASLSEGIFTDSSYDDEGVGHRQEEGIYYDEVFALVARIEAIRIFLAFDSYMRFIVYQMDVKSVFLYGTIDKEVYVSQPLGFIDPKFPNKVYKVVKALYGLHQDLKAWYATLSTFFEKSRYRKGAIDKTLFIKKDKKDMMLVQVVKTASTPIVTQKPLVKDEEAADVDVTPKTSHLYAVKRIFRKSTTGGCQFLGRRLISWQCKKQTIVATSTTKAEYVAAAHCCGQVLWIQNQLLDHGFNFMNTKIYIDNESTICIVKNLVFHSKIRHIEIRHHFIRDAYEKKLI